MHQLQRSAIVGPSFVCLLGTNAAAAELSIEQVGAALRSASPSKSDLEERPRFTMRRVAPRPTVLTVPVTQTSSFNVRTTNRSLAPFLRVRVSSGGKQQSDGFFVGVDAEQGAPGLVFA